jgi:hypothetical protein
MDLGIIWTNLEKCKVIFCAHVPWAVANKGPPGALSLQQVPKKDEEKIIMVYYWICYIVTRNILQQCKKHAM